MNHPYVGLNAVFRPGTKWEKRGVIAAVGQGGSVADSDAAFVSCILLLDDGTHFEGVLEFTVVNAEQAKARLRG